MKIKELIKEYKELLKNNPTDEYYNESMELKKVYDKAYQHWVDNGLVGPSPKEDRDFSKILLDRFKVRKAKDNIFIMWAFEVKGLKIEFTEWFDNQINNV